jgi:hypothetical protein
MNLDHLASLERGSQDVTVVEGVCGGCVSVEGFEAELLEVSDGESILPVARIAKMPIAMSEKQFALSLLI